MFGIRPTRPETGYGYIKVIQDSAHENICKVERFIEKPKRENANAYLNSGQYYWNSGMFVFQASCFLEELSKYAPDILHACKKTVDLLIDDLRAIRLDKTLFALCPSNSIDYEIGRAHV